jgi:hypothetical protein
MSSSAAASSLKNASLLPQNQRLRGTCHYYFMRHLNNTWPAWFKLRFTVVVPFAALSACLIVFETWSRKTIVDCSWDWTRLKMRVRVTLLIVHLNIQSSEYNSESTLDRAPLTSFRYRQDRLFRGYQQLILYIPSINGNFAQNNGSDVTLLYKNV